MSEKILDLFDEFVRETKQFWIIRGVGTSKEDWELTKFIVEWVDEYDDEEYTKYISVEKLISKKFWFIQWLVENDKIDREKVDINRNKNMSFVDFKLAHIDEVRLKVMLMLLSISDTPIDDLISYLK